MRPSHVSNRTRWPSARAWVPDAVAIALLMAAGAAVRLYGLETLSVWYDEGWTLYLTRFGPAEALRQIARYADPHPPGYYLLLIPWMRLLGQTAWAARAFSVLAGVLTVPALYYVGLKLLGRGAGLLAAVLLTLSPAHILYSQEARMYTLLGLCITLLFELYHRYTHRRATWRWWHWAALVVVQSLALYTHFLSAFVLAGLVAWSTLALALEARKGTWRPLAAWIAAQAAVALTLAPWAQVMLKRVAGHVTASTFTPPLSDFALETWSFLLAGQIDLLAPNPLYATVAIGVLGLLAIGAALVLWRGTRRRELVYLLLVSVCALLGVYLLMRLRPGFHPRYLFMLLPPLTVCVAHLVTDLARVRSWFARMGAAGILVCWLAATLLGGRLAWATAPWRDDARSAVAYLRQSLPAGSLIVAAYTGWELDYYLQNSGLATRFYGIGDFDRGIVDELAALVRQAPQVAYIRWRQSDTDHTGQIAHTLGREGELVAERHFPAYEVSVYRTSPELPLVRDCPAAARFGPLSLTGAVVQEYTPANGTVTVVLRWRLEESAPDDLKVALTLVDARGRVVAQEDRFLTDVHGMRTSRWQPPADGATYHTLPLSPGAAPLAYRLQVVVYHEDDPKGLQVLDSAGAPAGRSLDLCEISLAPAVWRAGAPTLPDRQALGLTIMPEPAPSFAGLELAAHRIDRPLVHSGETLSVLLEWRNASAGALPDLWPILRLVRDGQVLAEDTSAPVYGAYPTPLWAPGEIVLEWRDLLIPADVGSGLATLEILTVGEPAISLGAVELVAIARTFERPPMQQRVDMALGEAITFAGYDLSAVRIAPGGDLQIKLHWQSLGPVDRNLTVFVHLVSEQGRLIAQHDGIPAQGARPTTGWIAGEYITDEHLLRWNDPAFTGKAALHVGLYDATTGERLLALSGESSLLLADEIVVE